MQARNTMPTYPDLAGKVAVVTGGSGGIGAATCRLLAANGARVAVNGRDPTRIESVVDAIRDGGGEAIAPAWPGRDRHHGLQRGPAARAGRAGGVHGRQGRGDHAHPPGRQRGGSPRRPRQLPGPAHQPDRAAPAGGARGVAGADGGGDPAATAGHPEDVAQAAVFLASDSAAWLTGVTLDVAGGFVMT